VKYIDITKIVKARGPYIDKAQKRTIILLEFHGTDVQNGRIQKLKPQPQISQEKREYYNLKDK